MNDVEKLNNSQIKEIKIQLLNKKELNELNKEISKEEISNIINTLNTRKAAGYDGTTNLMIKIGK